MERNDADERTGQETAPSEGGSRLQDGGVPSGMNAPTRVTENNGHPDDSDDDETVIFLDSFDERNPNASGNFDWMEQATEEHRRTILHQELHRVQRSAFLQFASLCMFPILVIIFVIVTAVNDEALCGSSATECYPEPRTFLNAFSTRCVCDPIRVLRNNTEL